MSRPPTPSNEASRPTERLLSSPEPSTWPRMRCGGACGTTNRGAVARFFRCIAACFLGVIGGVMLERDKDKL